MGGGSSHHSVYHEETLLETGLREGRAGLRQIPQNAKLLREVEPCAFGRHAFITGGAMTLRSVSQHEKIDLLCCQRCLAQRIRSTGICGVVCTQGSCTGSFACYLSERHHGPHTCFSCLHQGIGCDAVDEATTWGDQQQSLLQLNRERQHHDEEAMLDTIESSISPEEARRLLEELNRT